MRKMNILLINPSPMPSIEQEALLNKSSILRAPAIAMPMGLIDLAAYLRENSENVNITILDIAKDLAKIFENQKNTSSTTLREFIKSELDTIDFEPDIVGISILFSTAHKSSITIAKIIKEKWKNTIVSCGGNHATNFYQYLLKDPNIDYVLRGEGEISFTEFVKKIQNNETNIDVYGIFDKNKITKNLDEISPMIEDINQIPIPAFDLLDIKHYRKIAGSLLFSRGCYFKCTYCAAHTVHGRKMRFKSIERILVEFKKLVEEYKFDKIRIEDDLLAADKKLFLEIAKELAQYKSIKYFLPSGLSVTILDEEIIDAMIKMGIDEGPIAIESGSTYVQKHIIKKNVSLDKTIRILKYLRKQDFRIFAYFIMGFPGETKTMMQETIDFIKSIDVDWVFILHASPLPGSEICNQFVSRGIINLEDFDWETLRFGKRSFDTPEISAKELEALIYDINIECNFFQNSNLKNGNNEKAIELLNNTIIHPYPFHIVGLYCRALAYLNLKEEEKAMTDLKTCVYWIENNKESKRLYERYNEKMPLLKDVKYD